MIKLETDYEKMVANIVKEASGYVKRNHIKALVLGVSGGLDSAVTAALAREICNKTEISLIGMSLHTEFNKEEEVENAKKVCRAFCHEFHEMPIKEITSEIDDHLRNCDRSTPPFNITKEEKIRRGNVAARVRMICLYHMAHCHNGMVLSTCNITECQLGFWTLHGDVGDYGLIGALWKTEVYGVASWLLLKYLSTNPNSEKAEALTAAIKAIPTDGLGITESDFDQLGAGSYKEIDTILIGYLNGGTSVHLHPAVVRHRKSAFKRIKDKFVHRVEILR